MELFLIVLLFGLYYTFWDIYLELGIAEGIYYRIWAKDEQTSIFGRFDLAKLERILNMKKVCSLPNRPKNRRFFIVEYKHM